MTATTIKTVDTPQARPDSTKLKPNATDVIALITMAANITRSPMMHGTLGVRGSCREESLIDNSEN